MTKNNQWLIKSLKKVHVLTLATVGVPLSSCHGHEFEHAGSHGKSYENDLPDEVDGCCNLNLHSPWYSYQFQLVSVSFSIFHVWC